MAHIPLVGVAGWVYLLGLVLAVTLYALLPLSSIIHSWKFDNYIVFQGFTKDQRRLVFTEWTNGPARFHHLHIDTGAITTYAAKDHPDEELDFKLIMKKPYQLTYASMIQEPSKAPYTLIRPDGSCRELPFTPAAKTETILVKGSPVVVRKFVGSQEFAITEDEHWLIVNHREEELWLHALPWLKKHFSWDLSEITDGWRYSARIFDLTTNQEYRCHLRTLAQPQFQVHPRGDGFAAFDIREKGTPTVYTSVINWYHLPPGRGYHSARQWGLIAGVFLLPPLLTLIGREVFRWRRTTRSPTGN